MRTVRSLRILLVSACLVVSMPAAEQAQTMDTAAMLSSPTLPPEARKSIQDRIEAVHAKFRESQAGLAPDQFGLRCCQILQIPATSFNPADSSTSYSTPGNGFVWPNTSDLRATVTLPGGAVLDYIDLYYYDADAASNICVELRALTGPTILGDAPATILLDTACSGGSLGFGYAVKATSVTINNNVYYDPAGAQYIVAITHSPSASPSLWFKAVDFWWHRQISPPPATQTFNDVGPGDFGYQHIEALAASGITGGCGNGNYCPNNPLTRAQMAVFLAKALGLYWPW